jgi:hypothetical protein
VRIMKWRTLLCRMVVADPSPLLLALFMAVKFSQQSRPNIYYAGIRRLWGRQQTFASLRARQTIRRVGRSRRTTPRLQARIPCRPNTGTYGRSVRAQSARREAKLRRARQGSTERRKSEADAIGCHWSVRCGGAFGAGARIGEHQSLLRSDRQRRCEASAAECEEDRIGFDGTLKLGELEPTVPIGVIPAIGGSGDAEPSRVGALDQSRPSRRLLVATS